MADPRDPAPDLGADGAPSAPALPCRHLRSNGLYLYNNAGNRAEHEPYSSSACWCQRTMTGFGPDDDSAGWADCRSPARPCYEPLY